MSEPIESPTPTGRDIEASDLEFMGTTVVHCGRAMRYRNSLTSWQGAPGEGSETTTVHRVCACGAELMTKLTRPA